MEKREIVNNLQGKPFEHYSAMYRELDPEEAARRCGVQYYAEDREFEVVFMGNRYRVSFPEYDTRCIDKKYPADQLNGLGKGYILLLRHLIEGKRSPWNGRFCAYKELPWGDLYSQQFAGRCLNRMAFTYGKRIDDFRAILEKMGGEPIKNGDAGYELEFMPGLRVQLMLWEADDEFPPSAQFLFSDNFPEAFAPEDLAVVGDVTLNAMKETEAWLKANK